MGIDIQRVQAGENVRQAGVQIEPGVGGCRPVQRRCHVGACLTDRRGAHCGATARLAVDVDVHRVDPAAGWRTGIERPAPDRKRLRFSDVALGRGAVHRDRGRAYDDG